MTRGVLSVHPEHRVRHQDAYLIDGRTIGVRRERERRDGVQTIVDVVERHVSAHGYDGISRLETGGVTLMAISPGATLWSAVVA